MVNKANILCFAGSARRESANKKLVRVAMQGAQEAGAAVTFIDLKDFDMPIYCGDIEEAEGLPENARKLKELMMTHNGLLIACPEYNSSITPLLKNVIDWTSRPEKGGKPLECYKGKVAGIMAASPGAIGGLRGLVTVRSILGNIGVIVATEQQAIAQAYTAFAEDGSLKDEKQASAVKNIGARVAKLAICLA